MRFDNLREDIRRWGLAKSLYVRAMRRIERAFGIKVFVVHARALDPNVEVDAMPPDCSARLLTEAELIGFAGEPQFDMSEQSIRAACARGDVCFGYLERGALVAFSWYATKPTRAEAGLWVRFRAGYSYGYKSLTLPSHRGRHLQQRLIPVAERWRTEHGARYNIGYIHVLNLSSIKADRRYGNRAVGYAAYARWFGHTILFHSPGTKRCGFEFFVPTPAEIA